MKKTIKLVSFLLALLLMSSVLIACGGDSNSDEDSQVEKPVTSLSGKYKSTDDSGTFLWILEFDSEGKTVKFIEKWDSIGTHEYAPVKYEIKDSSFILREQILFVPFQKDESYPVKQKGDFLYIGDTEWVKD